MKIKCWKCGKEAKRTAQASEYDPFTQSKMPCNNLAVSKWYRCYCDDCYEAVKKQVKEEEILYVKIKKREMFRKACKVLESQHTNMYEYKEAIDTVESVVEEKPDKFDSSYEILAAIVLVHENVLAKAQYKIGRYQADFVLPEMRVVLEIDGERHKYKKDYDRQRDANIKKALGEDWEIVRIETDLLDQNAKRLVKAIDAVLERREIRRMFAKDKTAS